MFRDDFSQPFFFTQRVLIKPKMSTARTRPYNGGNQQPWKKQKTGNGGFQPRQQPQQLDAMCEVCENGDNVVQREVKKEGPNQGTQKNTQEIGHGKNVTCGFIGKKKNQFKVFDVNTLTRT